MSVNDATEYDIIDLPDTITEEGEEIEVPMEPLFRLNGEEYLIPATPSAGMALGYLEIQTVRGPDAPPARPGQAPPCGREALARPALRVPASRLTRPGRRGAAAAASRAASRAP